MAFFVLQSANAIALDRTVKTLHEARTLVFPEKVGMLAWSPDGSRIAGTNFSDNRVYLYDLRQARIIWKIIKAAPGAYGNVAFDADGRYVITSSAINFDSEHNDTTLSLIDSASGHITKSLVATLPDKGDTNSVFDFALSSDKTVLACLLGIKSGRIALYDTTSWQVTGYINTNDGYGLQRIVLDANRHILTVAFRSGKLQTWDYIHNRMISEFQTTRSSLSMMAINRETGDVVTGGTGVVRTKRIHSGEEKGSFATLRDDPTLLVNAWNPLTGERVATYAGPGLAVSGLAVSPDGRYVAATKGKHVGEGSYLLVWKSDTAELVGQIDYDRRSAVGVAFSPDSRKIAVSVGSNVNIIALP